MQGQRKQKLHAIAITLPAQNKAVTASGRLGRIHTGAKPNFSVCEFDSES
jgi:hypothetical protein